MIRALALLLAAPAAAPAAAQEAPTWAEVGPLLARNCVICHSGGSAPRGLRLDSLDGALAGSRDGPVLVAGDPAGSELVRRVRGRSQPAMPLYGVPLAEADIALIEAWIVAGLPAGAAEPPAVAGPPGPPGPDDPVTFAHVEPIFLRRCMICHSAARPEGPPEGVRLGSLPEILEGGERLVLVPGNPEASEIVRRIEGTARPRMPYDGPPWLADEEIALIRRWIAEGAPDAEGTPSPVPVGREVRFRGRMTGPEEIDGIAFLVDGGTRIDDRPAPGQEGEVRGVIEADGGIRATRLRDR